MSQTYTPIRALIFDDPIFSQAVKQQVEAYAESCQPKRSSRCETTDNLTRARDYLHQEALDLLVFEVNLDHLTPENHQGFDLYLASRQLIHPPQAICFANERYKPRALELGIAPELFVPKPKYNGQLNHTIMNALENRTLQTGVQ